MGSNAIVIIAIFISTCSSNLVTQKCNLDENGYQPFTINGNIVNMKKVYPKLDICQTSEATQKRLISVLENNGILLERKKSKPDSMFTLENVIKIMKDIPLSKKEVFHPIVCDKYSWSYFYTCGDQTCLEDLFRQLPGIWCNSCGYMFIHPETNYDFEEYFYYTFYVGQFPLDLFCEVNILWAVGTRHE